MMQNWVQKQQRICNTSKRGKKRKNTRFRHIKYFTLTNKCNLLWQSKKKSSFFHVKYILLNNKVNNIIRFVSSLAWRILSITLLACEPKMESCFQDGACSVCFLLQYQHNYLYSWPRLVWIFSFSFFSINFYCSVVALQCCVSLYCIAKWINCTYTCISFLLDFLSIQATMIIKQSSLCSTVCSH